jgi:hypothetical protein
MQKCLILALLAAFASEIAFAQSVQAPIHTVGEQWTYQTIAPDSSKILSEVTRTTLGIDGDAVRYALSERIVSPATGQFLPPKTTQVTEHADLSQMTNPEKEKLEIPNFKWPLEVGEKWGATRKINSPSIMPFAAHATYTLKTYVEVVKWEDVNTPVGKFKTLKIVYTFTNQGPHVDTTSVNTLWYSPDLHRDVKSMMETIVDGGPSPQIRFQTHLIQYKPK